MADSYEYDGLVSKAAGNDRFSASKLLKDQQSRNRVGIGRSKTQNNLDTLRKAMEKRQKMKGKKKA